MTGLLQRLASLACLLVLLAACTGTDSGLGLPQDPDQAAAQAQFPEIDGVDPATGLAAPASPSGVTEIARLHFAPIVGASQEMVTALSTRLGPVSRAYGIRLVPANTPDTTHEIKGYFSAFSENGSTSVVHVWDVITPSGQRVHRIQGQETVPGVTPDPWASVPPATMEAIADKVIMAYAAWVRSGT